MNQAYVVTFLDESKAKWFWCMDMQSSSDGHWSRSITIAHKFASSAQAYSFAEKVTGKAGVEMV